MTNEQLYLAIGVPILFNAALTTILFGGLSSRLNGLDKRIDDLRDGLTARIDDTRDMLRAEFLRVEGVMDARLKHLEERR